MTGNPDIFLGIDTSGRRTGLALVRDEEVLTERLHDGIDHDEVLPGLLEELLAEGRLDIGRVARIGVTHGPGMFTALRVGLAWAAALALSRGIPVHGVGTLEALAGSVATDEPVLALLDAHKGQVYAGLFRTGDTLLATGLYGPEELPAVLADVLRPGQRLLLAGDCVDAVLPAIAVFNPVPSGTARPEPAEVARIAARLIASVGPDNPAALAPVYLRRTDAELSRKQSGRP